MIKYKRSERFLHSRVEKRTTDKARNELERFEAPRLNLNAFNTCDIALSHIPRRSLSKRVHVVHVEHRTLCPINALRGGIVTVEGQETGFTGRRAIVHGPHVQYHEDYARVCPRTRTRNVASSPHHVSPTREWRYSALYRSSDQKSRASVCARCGISKRTLINNLIEEPASVLQPRLRGAGSLIKIGRVCTKGTHIDSRAPRSQLRHRGKSGESRCPLPWLRGETRRCIKYIPRVGVY